MKKNICLTLNSYGYRGRVLKDINLKMYISDMDLLCKHSNKKYSMLLTCKQSTSAKNIYTKNLDTPTQSPHNKNLLQYHNQKVK